MHSNRRRAALSYLLVLTATLTTLGCHGPCKRTDDNPALSGIPRELDMAMHPTYRVAPPDILSIDAVNNIRPPDAKLRAGDSLLVRLANPEPLSVPKEGFDATDGQMRREMEAQFKYLNGDFVIQPDGALDFGPIYGKVKVAGLTLIQSQDEVKRHLETYVKGADGNSGLENPEVSVTWPDIAGKQAISGEHLVRPDGSIQLGIYGSIRVSGMTLAEVKQAVEQALAPHVHEPEVNVDVLAYNSKVFYVILDGGGSGEQVQRFPITGNETVLDAIYQVQGLTEVSSKRVWVARPAPAGTDAAQVMLVNWHDVTAEGITDTNFQLLPGDRVYVQADDLVAFDNFIGKFTAPLEKILGFTSLGTSTAKQIKFFGRFNNSGGGSF